MITLFAVDCWSTAAHLCAWPIASRFQRLAAAAFAASSSSNPYAFACSHCCGCCGAATLLLPVAGRQASLAAVSAMATLADVCPHHETERGAAAKVLGRTGSEGVRGGFREQS